MRYMYHIPTCTPCQHIPHSDMYPIPTCTQLRHISHSEKTGNPFLASKGMEKLSNRKKDLNILSNGQKMFMARCFQKGPNYCCSTMGSFENQWFYEKLIFPLFTVENCLKTFARRTVLAINLEHWTDFHFVKRTGHPINRTTKVSWAIARTPVRPCLFAHPSKRKFLIIFFSEQ